LFKKKQVKTIYHFLKFKKTDKHSEEQAYRLADIVIFLLDLCILKTDVTI